MVSRYRQQMRSEFTLEALCRYANLSDPSDLELFLARELGSARLPLSSVVPTTVLYGIMFAAGVMGNVAVCLVVAKNR